MNLKRWILATIFIPALTYGQVLKTVQTDPPNDVHHNMRDSCYPNRDTDIIKTEFNLGATENEVIFHLAAPVNERFGYKEFYFWIDVDAANKKGYQPYNPKDVAWPDMYADYRIFFSLDGPKMIHQAVTAKLAMQNCSTSDCSQDEGLKHMPKRIKAKVQGQQVRISWDKDLIPELKTADSIKLGYTTYYEQTFCNGEDDSPQWGQKAHHIDLKK